VTSRPSGAKNRSVLVVDDNVDLQDAIGDVLADAGYTPIFATDGQNALDYLRAHEAPSLILLDLMMPVMDGMQFREEQLRDPALAHIPVVILSADGKLHQKVKHLSPAGALAKPVQIDDLLSTVARFCDGPPSA
jgi:CheY-like chemotaxis protein